MQDVEATILSQYANSPVICQLIAGMNANIDPSANIDAFYNLVWNVDTAVGYGLDVWGRIVGVGRVLNVAAGEYFGFTGPAGASGLGFGQAIFYHGEPLTSNYALTDDAFRALILAKALANISNATIGSINQILINIFGPNGPFPVAGNSCVRDLGGMAMQYVFSAALDPVQATIVYQSGVLPRPAGVLSNVVAPSTWFWIDGGVLVLLALSGYPTGPSGLPDGAVYSNGLVVSVVAGVTPDPTAVPVYFADTSAEQLLDLSGGNLPLARPGTGTGQLWNNGGVVCVA